MSNEKQRVKHLKYNTITLIAQQIITLLCGFILPKLILEQYGSEINGLVNSITQFLGVVSFLQLGIGAIVQASLYKPLAENDHKKVSEIYKSTNKFMRGIAVIYVVYTVSLLFLYPFFVDNIPIENIYLVFLILSISLGNFLDYCFGITDGILLTADQHAYVQYTLRSVFVILNTVISAVLILWDTPVWWMKMISSLVFVVRPIIQRLYVKKHYNIDYKIELKDEPIAQKWNGIAQHISAFVLNQTDTLVLTIGSSLINVSVYSIYNMVLTGVRLLIVSFTYSLQNAMGDMWARKEIPILRKTFRFSEWLLHTLVTLGFGCTGVLIIPFVRVYTVELADVVYINVPFAVTITLAIALYCLNTPYTDLVFAVGHFKQTQNVYIVSATLNLLLSIVLVQKLGLMGVAIGTLVAMTYLLIAMIVYNSRNIIKIKIKDTLFNFLIDLIIVFISTILTINIPLITETVVWWLVKALVTAIVWVAVSLLINILLNKHMIVELIGILKSKIKHQ